MNEKTISDIINNAPSFKPETTSALQVLNLKEILSLEVKPCEWIMQPILRAQGLAMVYAARGVGKTFVALSLALSIASGKSMFDGKWVCDTPKKVLLLDGEMPLAMLQERLARLVASLNIGDDYAEYLSIITPDLQEHNIPDLSTYAGQQVIEKHVEGFDLLIIDNLSCLVRSGRENEAESWGIMQEWLLSLRRKGVTVLLVHHANKNGTQRGTSKKEDILDTVISLKQPSDYKSFEGARFEVHYEKARSFYGEEAEGFEVTLLSDDMSMSWEISELKHGNDALILAKSGLTQRQIAEKLGTSASTVNRVIKAQSTR